MSYIHLLCINISVLEARLIFARLSLGGWHTALFNCLVLHIWKVRSFSCLLLEGKKRPDTCHFNWSICPLGIREWSLALFCPCSLFQKCIKKKKQQLLIFYWCLYLCFWSLILDKVWSDKYNLITLHRDRYDWLIWQSWNGVPIF